MTQPLKPASASDAPINFRKVRRSTGSFHSSAAWGNSRLTNSSKMGESASSSSVRQYSFGSTNLSLSDGSPRIRANMFLIGSGSPFHVENFLFRSHVVFGRAVTFQTPFHLQRLCLRNHGHLIDASVTSRTTDAFCDVN